VIGRWAAQKAKLLFCKAQEARNVDPMLGAFFGNIAYTAMIAFVVVAALGKLGIQTASFVAILGAAGLAVALAFQSSSSNLAARVLMVTFRPFNVGDFVEAGGVSGRVEETSIFTTTMLTADNKCVIVPNAALSTGTITNYSAKSTRRVDMVFGVGYDAEIDQVRNIITKVLNNDKRVLDEPEPTVEITELADSSVNFVVRPWVKSEDYWAVHFSTHETLKKRFDSAGIYIPYPQADVHLHQVA
jgi:small conductance mechanosensitive channel